MIDLVICKICNEPVWNFICVDCLAGDIERVLPREFLVDFKGFHKDVVKNFRSDYDFEPCVKCREKNPVSVCPYCYLNEAYQWLLEKDSITAKRLIRFIPLFRRHGPEEWAEYMKSQAITDLDNRKTINGICDECGEYYENLELKERGFVCEHCKE